MPDLAPDLRAWLEEQARSSRQNAEHGEELDEMGMACEHQRADAFEEVLARIDELEQNRG